LVAKAQALMELVFFIALFVVPFGGALVLAAFLGKCFRTKLAKRPGWLKIGGAGLLAASWPFVYLIVWQTIDVALREAQGDTSEYMGPVLMLLYGFPITLLTVVGCFFVAAYTSVGRE